MPKLNKQVGKPKSWRSNRSRPSTFHLKSLARELHELLELPMSVLHSSGGFRYERPLKGTFIIRTIIKTMVDALQRGESIRIPGFGTFKVESRNVPSGGAIRASTKDGRIIGNTKTSIPHPPKQKVVFYPSVHLQAMVNLKFPNVPNYHQKIAIESWKH